MRIMINRLTGILLFLAAAGGLIFSILGLVGIWRLKPIAIVAFQDSMQVLNLTLQTTTDGLGITRQAIQSSSASLSGLQSTMVTTANTIDSTEPLITSLANIVAQDFPVSIQAAQSSLDSASASARTVDTVLQALSLLPGIDYNPEIPLATALDQLSTSLDNFPQTFTTMEANLQETSLNLQGVQVDLLLIADSVTEIQTSLSQFEGVVLEYQASVKQLQEKSESLNEAAPQIFSTLFWSLSFFLIWLAIAQLSLFLHAWEMFFGRKGNWVSNKGEANSSLPG